MFKFIQDGTRNMRFICSFMEPGALHRAHSGFPGSIQFPGTAVTHIQAFFRFHFQQFRHFPVQRKVRLADSLLIGKGSYASVATDDGGIARILLKDDNGKKVPDSKTSGFDNNAKYQFTSSYILMTLLCADPSKSEAEASLYTTTSYRGSNGSASFRDIGLWSYYPSRGNWNRE